MGVLAAQGTFHRWRGEVFKYRENIKTEYKVISLTLSPGYIQTSFDSLLSLRAAAMTMTMMMAVMRQAESATQKLLFSVWLAAVLSSAWVWFLQSGVPLAGNQASGHFLLKTKQRPKTVLCA